MVAKTATRSEENSPGEISARVFQRIQRNIEYHILHPEEISRRLRELDAEWDTDRCVQIGASAFSILGILWAIARRKKGLLFPLISQMFLIQHAIEGSCAPVSVLRQLGIRTKKEIEAERNALMAIRGDFKSFQGSGVPSSSDETSAAESSSRKSQGVVEGKFSKSTNENVSEKSEEKKKEI